VPECTSTEAKSASSVKLINKSVASLGTSANVLHQWAQSPLSGDNCVEELAPFDGEKYYVEDFGVDSPKPSVYFLIDTLL